MAQLKIYDRLSTDRQGGGPTLHPPTLHEDNSTQKLDTERLYTRAALHQITLQEKQ